MNKGYKNFVNYGTLMFVFIIFFIATYFFLLGDLIYSSNEDWINKWKIVKINDTIPIPIIDTTRVPIIDTTRIPKIDTITEIKNSEKITWSWVDFDGINREIICEVPKDAIKICSQNRKNSQPGYGIYSRLYKHDVEYLEEFINKFKKIIKSENMDYLESLNLVCSAIQSINYTLIITSQGIETPPKSKNFYKCPCKTHFGEFTDDCSSSRKNGCCNNVDPFGIYSPYEFFYKKTGDCDTRALLAYTILKKIGFNVAVMVSDKESHSVLGVYLPSAKGKASFSRDGRFMLWELTSKSWRFPKDRVNGSDWIAVLE